MTENTTPKNPSGKTNAQVEEVADKEATVKTTAKNSVSSAPAKPQPKPREKTFVVSDADTDEVFASAIIVENRVSQKSLSVLHLQRTLTEQGYDIADGDPAGYYGPHTIEAVRLWREDGGVENPTGVDLTHKELTAIFDGDPNVTLVLDTPEL